MGAATAERRAVYLVAATSGLRRSVMARVEWRDADLSEPGRPLWRLRAGVSKNGLAATVPMTPECASALASLFTGQPRTARIFQRIPRIRTMHGDLRRAGLTRIDSEGRRLDFHSLRYFFCTQLARSLPIQKVRILMRHQTLRQTCDLYCDLGIDDVAGDIWSLPSLLENHGQSGGGHEHRHPQERRNAPPTQDDRHGDDAQANGVIEPP
jgi:integrase